MKSLKNIAKIVLERRSRMTHVVLPGDLAAEIGSEGMQEALRRTWIEADTDSGALKVSSNLNRVQEMEQIAEAMCEDCKKEPCECDPSAPAKKAEPAAVQSESRVYAMRHSDRLFEWSAPGSGQPDRPAAPAVPPPAPPANPTQSPSTSQDHAIGENVVIADDGKSFPAVVKAHNQDGSYELSFGPNNKPVATRHYRKEEIQKAQPAGSPPAQ